MKKNPAWPNPAVILNAMLSAIPQTENFIKKNFKHNKDIKFKS